MWATLPGLAGCSSAAPVAAGVDGGDAAAGAHSVKIYSWWVAPGEAEALQALMTLNNKNYPTVSIVNQAKLSGANEVPPVPTGAMGRGDYTVNTFSHIIKLPGLGISSEVARYGPSGAKVSALFPFTHWPPCSS